MIITLDFETYYDANYTLNKMRTSDYVRDERFHIFGVGVKKGEAQAEWVPASDVEEALRAIDWGQHSLLAHNAAFDGFILSDRFGLRPRLVFDTMSMGRALHGMYVGASLNALSQREGLGHKVEGVLDSLKGVRHLTPEQETALGAYCVQDVELTYSLCKRFVRRFPPQELVVMNIFAKMVTEPALHLNSAVLETALRDEEEAQDAVIRACGIVGTLEQQKKVLRSRTAFPALLEAAGVEVPKKISLRTQKETYAFAKTDDAFTRFSDHPVAGPLVKARLVLSSALKETRTRSLLRTSRQSPVLPVFLNYWGAMQTGRASGGGNRDNLQNLPRKSALRDAIEAPPGHLLIVSDLASIEARVLSWSARDEEMLRAFRLGADPYLLMASDVFGRNITKEDKQERSLGKVLVLGLGYKMGFLRLARALFDGMMGNPPVIFDAAFAESVGAKWRDTIEWLRSCDDKFKQKIRDGRPLSLSMGQWLLQCAVSLHLVQIYRNARAPVKAYWGECDVALRWMADGHEDEVGVGVRTRKDALVLPDGAVLHYPRLKRLDGGEWTFQKANTKRKDFSMDTLFTYDGKVTENITQAIAGAVLRSHIAQLAQRGLPAKLQVHDELVFVVKEDRAEGDAKVVQEIMASAPEWAAGMPVGAETKIGRTYSEAK